MRYMTDAVQMLGLTALCGGICDKDNVGLTRRQRTANPLRQEDGTEGCIKAPGTNDDEI